MATIFSPSALLTTTTTNNATTSTTSSTTTTPPLTTKPHLPIRSTTKLQLPNLTTTALTAAALAAATIISTSNTALSAESYATYYGTAASAANYGGYGGNSDKKASAEYIYDIPEGWKERLVSKVEKGTNGTDSEFYNPKKRTEKEYLTFLGGLRQLAPKEAVLNNLALSDVNLQDLIASADSVTSEETKDDKGQVYYVYEIDGPSGHSLISVTCARNKLYAHFVMAPAAEWKKDQETLKHIHESFKTV
ncbi:thylakoid lumenal 19 kDa protein, chloroplastic [Rutidosis leptorrhynchoides]|uniref:thylakoid lumenal 19 kDa protein, chloroplastic n=1 Tax=Rutidosis leptorrhynchoides TaxID=125765 RepID=UPI003A99F7FB